MSRDGPSGMGGLGREATAYYADGDWYDAEYVHIRHDLPYYTQIAADVAGPILELACGTGRLTIPMASVGATVFGIDVSPGMISRAEAKRCQLPIGDMERLRFAVEDMRVLRLGEKFEAIVLAFNTLMHMTDDEDLEAVLLTVREHLGRNGRFHFDLHTPFPELASRDPDGRYDPQQMIDPRTRERYVVTENNRYDPRRQVNTMRFYYQKLDTLGRPVDRERMAALEMRVIFPRELDRWLHTTGFETVGDWDDFQRSQPFSGRGGRRVLEARVR